MAQDGKSLHVCYFAALREAAGRAEETVQSRAATAADLYRELARLHGMAFDLSILKVALNDRIVPWTSPVSEGDTVVFLAPFAGG